MQRVIRSTVIEFPVETVWDLARQFNGHAHWHPAIASSEIERADTDDTVGCVRRFRLADGQELREQLLSLSEADMAYSYCLLDTPIPLFNYVAHFRIFPITDGDHSFCEWESRFNTIAGQEQAMAELVGEGIYMAGFRALSQYLLKNADLEQVTS